MTDSSQNSVTPSKKTKFSWRRVALGVGVGMVVVCVFGNYIGKRAQEEQKRIDDLQQMESWSVEANKQKPRLSEDVAAMLAREWQKTQQKNEPSSSVVPDGTSSGESSQSVVSNGKWDEDLEASRKAAVVSRFSGLCRTAQLKLLSFVGVEERSAKAPSNEALTTSRKAAAIHPDDATRWKELGAALQNSGFDKWDEAIYAYRIATALQSDDDVTWSRIGFLLRWQKKHAESVAAYQKAAEISPENPDAWDHIGGGLSELGRLDSAVEAYLRAITIQDATGKDSESFSRDALAGTWFSLGDVLFKQGKPMEATRAWRKASSISPEQVSQTCEIYFTFALSNEVLGKLDVAIANYRKLAAFTPERGDVWCALCFMAGRECSQQNTRGYRR